VWDWATANTQAVIVQAFDPCYLEEGVWSVAIATGQQSLGGCGTD